METLKFKTNIKCGGCISVVGPELNKTVGENNWSVDLQDPDKILTVTANTTDEKVVSAIKGVGYEAEPI